MEQLLEGRRRRGGSEGEENESSRQTKPLCLPPLRLVWDQRIQRGTGVRDRPLNYQLHAHYNFFSLSLKRRAALSDV